MSPVRESIAVDPCGDVYLVLERPDKTTVVDNHLHLAAARNGATNDSPVDDAPADNFSTDNFSTDNLSTDNYIPDDFPVDDISTDGLPVDDIHNDHNGGLEASEHGHEPDINPSIQQGSHEVELRVSSKHMSIASQVFGKALEGQPTGDKDKRTILLLQDDFGAMHILMNIIHGWTRRVPKRVDVQVFKQVVGLIDKYEFHEAAETFTDMWFDSLRETLLQDHHRDLASWIFICWVLQKPSEYNVLTKKAIWETNGELQDDDGRVPYWVLREFLRTTIFDHASNITRRDIISSANYVEGSL